MAFFSSWPRSDRGWRGHRVRVEWAVLMPDRDGYPTPDELDRILEWPWPDGVPIPQVARELLAFVKGCWWAADWGWSEEDGQDNITWKPVRRYSLSTGGWSGNEAIIAALRENGHLFPSFWIRSRRGGHYVFEVPLEKDGD